MRRLFWLAMGVTIGALVVRKLSRAAEKVTPAGIGASIAEGLRELADAIGDFGADVRAAMARAGVRAAGRHRLDAAARARPGQLPGGTHARAPRPPLGRPHPAARPETERDMETAEIRRRM
jgi:hypothetical protein